jgi:hypothetical protein
MTEVAIKAEMNDRLKGRPHDSRVKMIKADAEGYYAKLNDGVVWMRDRRKLPARVFDYL